MFAHKLLVINTDAGLDAFAATVAGHLRRYGEFPTAVGYALGYGAVFLSAIAFLLVGGLVMLLWVGEPRYSNNAG